MPVTKRTKPLFRLTNSTSVKVVRPSVTTYVNGRPVEGTPTEYTVQANVQPLKPYELMLLPETDRTKEWIRLYSDLDQDIRPAKEGEEGWEADSVEWNGFVYKVMKQETWQMGVLDHYKTYAARTPISAGL